MSQTSYGEQSAAFPGMKASLSPSKVSSYVSVARLAFGTAVCLGDNLEKQVAAPAGATDVTDLKKFRGVIIHDHTNENNTGDGLEAGVEAKKPLNVLEKGEAYVVCVEDVVPTDEVYCIHTGAGIGKFRNDADTANASLVPNARFRSNSITVGGVKIAILELY